MILSKSSANLLKVQKIDLNIQTFLQKSGEVFKIFDQQDSGCVSYGVDINGQRWFVKESAEPRTISSLKRAIKLHRVVQHSALAKLRNKFDTPNGGLALVYDWLPGEIIYNLPEFPRETGRRNPESAHVRFCALPVETIIRSLSTIYDLHRVLAETGFIAVDFYDGCILFDFENERTYIVDLDEYHYGPFSNPTDRLLGSSRFMAPEEFQRGALIDQITNVFTLGRTALVILAGGNIQNWQGKSAAKRVLEQATQPNRSNRYPSVAAFVDAWESAVSED